MKYPWLIKQFAMRTYTGARWFDKELKQKEKYFAYPECSDDLIPRLLLQRKPLNCAGKDRPMILSLPFGLFYAWIPARDGYYLLGPTKLIGNLKPKWRAEISEEELSAELAEKVSEYSLDLFSDDILLCYNLERKGGKKEPFLEEQDLLTENLIFEDGEGNTLAELYNTIFENVENRFVHNPYSHEKRQVASIRNGDVETLEQVLNERFPGRYGKVAANPLRQEINIGIVETTLASRAAIEGGLHPETAFYLSDITLQKLDNCRDSASAMRISREMQINYAKLVRDIRHKNQESLPRGENVHISRCKDYVFAHLHGKLTVREIAHAIGLEENYLSSLFKRQVGESLTGYILREKIKLAENLLMYSAYSYVQIASYLGFASQSHFGQTFKKITGMTPKSYREAYAKEDFLNDTLFFNDD